MISFDAFYNIDTLAHLLKDFLLALSISSLGVFSGILFMAFACLVAFQKKRLGVYGKGAKQLATLGLIFGWGLLIVIRVWLYYFPDKLIEYCWIGMASAVLLQSIHLACWKKVVKTHPLFQKICIFLNALLAIATGSSIIFLIRSQIQVLFPSGISPWGTLQPFTSLNMVRDYLFYFHATSVGLSILIAMSVPAAWGAFLLPCFKKYQDFGRDHYRNLVRWVSLWARNTWFCVWMAQCLLTLAGTWYLWQAGNTNLIDITIIAVRQIIWLIPVVLWSVTGKSGHPLRHKLGLCLALLISISLF